MNEAFVHEIVIPTDPLFAWVQVFKDQTGLSYIALHWHEGIELSFTIHGRIDRFMIEVSNAARANHNPAAFHYP